jgi:hypothetical protein
MGAGKTFSPTVSGLTRNARLVQSAVGAFERCSFRDDPRLHFELLGSRSRILKRPELLAYQPGLQLLQ